MEDSAVGETSEIVVSFMAMAISGKGLPAIFVGAAAAIMLLAVAWRMIKPRRD
jgi:hypothetical protein